MSEELKMSREASEEMKRICLRLQVLGWYRSMNVEKDQRMVMRKQTDDVSRVSTITFHVQPDGSFYIGLSIKHYGNTEYGDILPPDTELRKIDKLVRKFLDMDGMHYVRDWRTVAWVKDLVKEMK
jgi:hypothetical protein